MKYKVITRCFWNKRLWELDAIVEIDPALNPPKHFVRLDQVKEPPKLERPDVMAPKPMSYGQPIKMAAGFAANLDIPKSEPMQTASLKRPGRPRKQ